VAGGIVAQELVAAGLRDVVVVEAGKRIPMRDSRTWYDVLMSGRNPYEHVTYKEGVDFENTGPVALNLEGGLLRVRGGTTLHWEGMAYRLKPEDFRLRSATGLGADWPIRYEDLEPSYALAERTLRVAGEASDEGHPPRSGAFPLPPFPAQSSEEPFLRAMAELGMRTQHACVSRNSKAIDGKPPCQKTGTCIYCPIGGRFTADQVIDGLEAPSAGVRVLTSTSAQRLEFASRRRAVSLRASKPRTGEDVVVEAERFVICGGAIETPKLLLASKSSWWPKGPANDTDVVGRYLSCHLFQSGSSVADKGDRRSLEQLAFMTSVSRHFDRDAFQARGKFMVCPSASNADVASRIMKNQARAQIRSALDDHRERSLWFQLEQLPSEQNTVFLARGTDSLGLPRTGIRYSMDDWCTAAAARARSTVQEIFLRMGCKNVEWGDLAASSHFMGSCRAGTSPETSVVDANLALHGVDNVYLCGSSVFASVGAASPTLTIAALAHRLGRHLAGPLPSK
jgi:choline dehydrogenase-like flavoprotein